MPEPTGILASNSLFGDKLKKENPEEYEKQIEKRNDTLLRLGAVKAADYATRYGEDAIDTYLWMKRNYPHEVSGYYGNLSKSYATKLLGPVAAGLSVYDMSSRANVDAAKNYVSRQNNYDTTTKESGSFPYTQAFMQEFGARMPGYLEGMANVVSFGAYDANKMSLENNARSWKENGHAAPGYGAQDTFMTYF